MPATGKAAKAMGWQLVALLAIFCLLMTTPARHARAETAASPEASDIEKLLNELGARADEESRVVAQLKDNLALKRSIESQYRTLDADVTKYGHDVDEASAYCSGTYEEPEYSRRQTLCANMKAEFQERQRDLDKRRHEIDARDAERLRNAATLKTSYDEIEKRAKDTEDALARVDSFAPISDGCRGRTPLQSLHRCLRDGWEAAVAAKAEQDEFDNMNAAWLRKQEDQVRAAVAQDARWRDEVLAAIKQTRVPAPQLGPASFADLRPGDVLLLTPESATSPTRLIPPSDWLYRATGHFASGESFRAAAATPDAPVSHALTVVKSVNGHLLFLDHTIEGSRILSQPDFERRYGARGVYVARPEAVVDGRALWQAARTAALQRKSDYGIFGDKVVCSERAGVAVAKATGLELGNKRIGPIDITPGDFFDDENTGKYFLVSPVSAAKPK